MSRFLLNLTCTVTPFKQSCNYWQDQSGSRCFRNFYLAVYERLQFCTYNHCANNWYKRFYVYVFIDVHSWKSNWQIFIISFTEKDFNTLIHTQHKLSSVLKYQIWWNSRPVFWCIWRLNILVKCHIQH